MLSQDDKTLPAMIALFADAGLQGLAWGKSEAVLRPARWSAFCPAKPIPPCSCSHDCGDPAGLATMIRARAAFAP